MLIQKRLFIIGIAYIILTKTVIVSPDDHVSNENTNDVAAKLPTILITILVRNKEHTLPYFLTYLEKLNYPKDRIALWIRSDHNEDRSIEIFQKWIKRRGSSYHSCDFKYDNGSSRHKNETSITDWPRERFKHIIQLKTEAFKKAAKLWADYIFFLDADVFLTDPNTLRHLTWYNVPIISPMLKSDGFYSNYWCGMSDDYYYQRTDEYREIYEYHKTGNYPVPMVHSAVLVNLNYVHADFLTFDEKTLLDYQHKIQYSKLYDGPTDDIIIFAISAKTAGLRMLISNEHQYGYILSPLDRDESIERDYQQLINIKLNIINDLPNGIVDLEVYLQEYVTYPKMESITLDKIYMVNLVRRPERREKMEESFKEMGLKVEHFPAVDGRELNLDIIEKMGIRFLPGYEDPYHHRQMTMGEIGCFLSHYKIWEKMVELEQQEVLILEDDIRFEPYFKDKAIHLLDEARSLSEWDLIYFGRKRLEDQDEPYVEGANNLVHVGYSYWTLGYVISFNGAKKLLATDPLRKLLPVDEFLPIMFDRHPNQTWNEAFAPRDLIAYSAAPLILFPTHYTGDEGYISDTEDSELTPITRTDIDTSPQLKSDKGRDNNSESLMNDKEINSKHKSGNNLFAHEISDNTKHDPHEL